MIIGCFQRKITGIPLKNNDIKLNIGKDVHYLYYDYKD